MFEVNFNQAYESRTRNRSQIISDSNEKKNSSNPRIPFETSSVDSVQIFPRKSMGINMKLRKKNLLKHDHFLRAPRLYPRRFKEDSQKFTEEDLERRKRLLSNSKKTPASLILAAQKILENQAKHTGFAMISMNSDAKKTKEKFQEKQKIYINNNNFSNKDNNFLTVDDLENNTINSNKREIGSGN